MSTVVYDAGVLVAADKNERRAWAEHKARLELGVIPVVPAPVIAQVSRSPQQAQFRRFLTGSRSYLLKSQRRTKPGDC